MTDLYNFPKHGCPFKKGDNYFHYFNRGLQNHSVGPLPRIARHSHSAQVLYKRALLTDEPQVFIVCISQLLTC